MAFPGVPGAAPSRGDLQVRVGSGSGAMGRLPGEVRAREGGSGRHPALQCRRVAVRARRRIRAVPDLRQRAVALRAASRGRRSWLSGDVRRPGARPKAAAMTSRPASRAGVKAITNTGVRHEQRTTAGGSCHDRADRCRRCVQRCRRRQRRLDRVAVEVGDAAAEGGLMSGGLRPLVALGLAGLIGLVGAGCGSTASSESGTASNSGSGATKTVSDQDKLVKLAECIRAHGVPHFPDPDPKGEYQFGIDVSPAVWKKATEACRDLTPPGTFSGKRSPKQQSDALRFAECVRENGVKDFPDPVNGDPLIDTTKIPSSNRPGGMTILKAATRKCGPILKLAAGGQGGNGG